MGNSASGASEAPGATHRKRYSVRLTIRRSTVASGASTEETAVRVHPARLSMQLRQATIEENPRDAEMIYEIDALDLKLYRHLSEGLVREIHTDAVWATIPHALNGRSSKALLVDRHQRVLTKRENSKAFQELKHHVHLSTCFCQSAQSDPTFKSQGAHLPRIQELQHPHIVRLYGHFTQSRMLHTLTEFCQHGNLATVLDFDERFEQKHERRLPIFHGVQALEESARQLCLGVRFIHESQLAHTNLTPQNVFVGNNGHILVGDFKDAIFVGPENKRIALPFPVRHEFTAPERYFTEEDESSSIKVDVIRADAWSVGMLIFMMSTREGLLRGGASTLEPDFVQFKRLGFAEFYEVWKTQGKGRSDPNLVLSDEIKQLLSELLQVNPEKRCTVVDVTQRFKWLRPGGAIAALDPSEWKLTA